MSDSDRNRKTPPTLANSLMHGWLGGSLKHTVDKKSITNREYKGTINKRQMQEKEQIILIEILESDIEIINVPFVVYAVTGKNNSVKLRALYDKLTAQKKDLVETYRAIDSIWKEEDGRKKASRKAN